MKKVISVIRLSVFLMLAIPVVLMVSYLEDSEDEQN